ncbi:MAG: hypothetical protein M1823_001608 [Watsoniomyces obsoletus]|nr:MAG: hypothetical protein M1823_001608 [Watsoniomyces obsoletus]
MAGLKPLSTPMRQPIPPPVHHAFGSSPPDPHPAQALSASSQPLRPPRRRSEHHMKDRMGVGGAERQGRRSIDVPNGRGQMGGHGGHHHHQHHQHMGNEHPRHGGRPGGMNAFEGARTPPSGKNTSHVPCKFFLQGACQAGKACPFAHSVDPATTQAPCKYFAKGNCKFGAKCALAHLLPDGRRVNRPSIGSTAGNLDLGGRVNPELYAPHPSALANSLMHAHPPPMPYGPAYPYAIPDEFAPMPAMPPPNMDSIPTFDMNFVASRPDSNYGSPRDESRLPVSPAIKGLSALDAPLPASFDSNGVSWIARNGPVAASVPSKFGLESPHPSEALRTLHDAVYGNGDRGRMMMSNLGSTPPTTSTTMAEASAPRIMHSQRFTKPKMMSASLPRTTVNDDWDSTFAFEEDFIPNSLHELLTPQEKMRRFSRSAVEDEGLNPRMSLSGIGTPADSSSKVGSPLASSPSRFGPLVSRQRRDEDLLTAQNNNTITSGFGHVGSPLRNSTLHPGASPGLKAISRPTPGDISPHFASPPRQTSMSMISQQLQRTRLSRAESGSTVDSATAAGSGPGSSNNNNKPSGMGMGMNMGMMTPSATKLDRVVSSSSVNHNRTVSSIDEEPGEVFSMEEEEDPRRTNPWNLVTSGARSPRPIGGERAVANIGTDGNRN